MRKQVPAVAAALLAVLAGCAGGLHAPTNSPEYTRAEIVPLVQDMNASEAQTLTFTHARTLNNTTSYRGRFVGGANGDIDYRRTIVIDRRHGRLVEHWWDATRSGDVFENATGQYRRVQNRSTDDYRYVVRRARHSQFEKDDYYARAVPLPDETVLIRWEFEYVGRENGGFVFAADSLRDADDVPYSHFYWSLADATGGEARMVVDERGFVRSFSSTVEFGTESPVASETHRVQVWDVGNARANRPAWVANATAATQ